VSFRIFVAYPPDREEAVAQLTVQHDGVMDIPAEVFRNGSRMTISLFSRTDGVAWQYPLGEFLAAIDAAVAALEPPSS
jgi:hypothetical protein